jgi:signal transduction histidine kinase/ActR/RegA family two-component response regulator
MNPLLYNSLIIDTFLRLIKARYNFIDINDLLSSAGMKAYEIADQGCWFTQEQVDRFYEKLVQLTGNEHIAREAGRYAASPETLGVMRQYALGLVGAERAFKAINKSSLKLTRSSTYTSRNVSANCVEIVVTPHEGVSEKPFQCENRIGFFEAVVLLFGHKRPHIEHPDCMFKGANACHYIITWENSLSLILKRAGAAAALLYVMASLALSVMGQWELLKNLSNLFAASALMLVSIIMTIEKKELKEILDKANETTDKLIEQIDSNFNNSLMINEVGQILNDCTQTNCIFESVMKIIENRLNYSRGMVFFTNSERNRLILKAAFGYSPEHLDLIKSLSFHIDLTVPQKGAVGSFLDQQPLLVNDLNELEEDLSSDFLNMYEKTGAQSFICSPIISEGKSLGLLVVDNVTKGRKFVASDASLLMGIASVIGVSLRNAELIEEKVRHEKERHKTEKLESLGVLAGGIAHDFNNILAIILGNCSLAKLDPDKSEDFLTEIEMASERAAALCRQMLAYAGKSQCVQTEINFTELVDDTVKMLKSTLPQNADITMNSPADIPLIKGDAGQLTQIVMNMIINASEAIGEVQGEIRVSLKKIAVKDEQLVRDHQDRTIPSGGYVCLEITDTGCGMDNEIRQRIFEPFYTTKFTGRGLGMSAVLGIISSHGGALQLFSQPEEGTTFRVYLPAQESGPAEVEPAPQASPLLWQGSGTILLVEDEELIRIIAGAMIRKLGFSVIEASNGREALELYQLNAADITLVITDMGMPVMDGYALFRELKKLKPELPIIISSGFGAVDVTSRIDRDDIAGLIGKPYNFDNMREVLKSVVGDARIDQN